MPGEDENITKAVIYRELSEIQSITEEAPPLDIAKMLQIAFIIKQEARSVNEKVKDIADQLFDELMSYNEKIQENTKTQLPEKIKELIDNLFDEI